MNEQAMRFRIGVFVLLAIILLGVLIMLFGRMPTFGKWPDRYTIVFQNATGLEEGTPVRRSGVRIGQVHAVELDDSTGRVRAVVDIERPHPLYESDVATLVHGLLSGDTSVDFIPSRTRKPGEQLARVQPGAELLGSAQADVSTLVDQTSAVVPTAQDALNEIRRTLNRFEKMAPLVEETLQEYRDLGRAARDLTPQLRDFLKSANQAAPDMVEIIKTARAMVPEIRQTNQEAQVTIRNWGQVGERVNLLISTNEDRLNHTLERFEDAVSGVANVFNPENQKNMNEILRNVSSTSRNLDNLTRNLDDFVKESRQSIKHIDNTIQEMEKVMVNLQKATKPLAERSEPLMKSLEELTDSLNKTVNDTRELLRLFNQSDGTMRRLLTDPSLYNNINDAVICLTRTLPRVDEILRNIEVFSDKLARHPESIGLGGAIRPSAGLKDSPFAPSRPRFGNP